MWPGLVILQTREKDISRMDEAKMWVYIMIETLWPNILTFVINRLALLDILDTSSSSSDSDTDGLDDHEEILAAPRPTPRPPDTEFSLRRLADAYTERQIKSMFRFSLDEISEIHNYLKVTNGETRLAVDRVKPWLTKMINSSSSNTMIWIGNLDLGHLIDILNYLATPTPKSSRFLITFSWIM